MNERWRDEIFRIKQYIDEHVCDIDHIYDLSPLFHLHCNVITSRFKEVYGICPKKYLIKKKIEVLIDYVRTHGNGETAYHYAYELGFKNETGLCKLLKRELNLTFNEFMEKYAEA